MIKSALKFASLVSLTAFASPYLIAEEAEIEDKFKLSGKAMVDYRQADPIFQTDDFDQFVIRRADLTAKYSPSVNWKSEVQINYDQTEQSFELKDAYISSSHLSNVDVTIGKVKEPMGLEYLTSSSKLATLERSMVTNTFAPKRNVGVLLSNEKKRYTWAVGLFNNAEDNDFSNIAVTARATYNDKIKLGSAPNSKLRFHLGASVSSRQNNPDDSIRINQSIELYDSNSVIESTKIDATDQFTTGVEFAFIADSLLLQTEYFSQSVTADPLSNDVDSDYDGYYSQLTYHVTGEETPYKKGKIGSIKPTSDYGALSLVVRFSDLSARDHYNGTEATSIYYGLNYAYSKKLRAQLGHQQADISGKNSIFINQGSATSLRLQYSF